MYEILCAGEFGLGGSVWGPDAEEAARVAMRMETGMVSIGD